MQKKSLTGKIKKNSDESEHSNFTIVTIAGKIKCLFSRKKEETNEVPEDIYEEQVCYLRPFKVMKIADLEHILMLIDAGYVVVSDLTKLDAHTRKIFISELKIRLWGVGKQFLEVNSMSIICGNLSVNKYQRNEEIIRLK